MFQVGIDSFAANEINHSKNQNHLTIQQLLERIECADKVGIDTFGIGEHHRKEFLDSAPHMILAAAARNTKNITLTSAVTVLSTADPVRIFQQFATLDLLSKGRAEIIVGRGSFSESFPLFGYQFQDYDDLFEEKLDLLLKLQENEYITWQGKFRPTLTNQPIFPRPLQHKIPIWIGVGGTPESVIRAGKLGLPLMIAIIGGQTARFKHLVDLYRDTGIKAGHSLSTLKVGVHCLGYVAENRENAIQDFYTGYKKTFDRIGKERGWSPITESYYKHQIDEKGALVVGNSKDIIEKIINHSNALGGLSRFTFQMSVAELKHHQLLTAINIIGKEISPILKKNITK
ncbi:LLM class flavin-dependent oxidoreductase [Candidatus Marinamargulisbacteria bacterium SCGC AG-414-C22]|nr:LLM class flavin-dependent oxidoreductase [Candidatus Marinamargulisbacteria bacterium SCGC AG-414-C22]